MAKLPTFLGLDQVFLSCPFFIPEAYAVFHCFSLSIVFTFHDPGVFNE